MEERDVLDLLLVAVLAVVTYARAFGLGQPVASLGEFATLLASLDLRVYLVVFGLVGIVFVGYLAVYLPRKNAARTYR